MSTDLLTGWSWRHALATRFLGLTMMIAPRRTLNRLTAAIVVADQRNRGIVPIRGDR